MESKRQDDGRQDLAAERWQRKMMPLMRSGLMMLAAFFFVASLVQYHLLYQDLQKLTPGGRLNASGP
jgi:hypothetical protein